MDKTIKQSIKARKDALFASFNVSAEAQKKIDALFIEIEKLGEKCKDASEFEAEFSKSPLNQKYLDLFTEIATKGAAKNAAKGAAVGAVQSATEQALQNVVPTRAAVHQKVSDELRSVPGLGDAIDIGEKASYAGHLAKLFGKRKKK